MHGKSVSLLGLIHMLAMTLLLDISVRLLQMLPNNCVQNFVNLASPLSSEGIRPTRVHPIGLGHMVAKLILMTLAKADILDVYNCVRSCQIFHMWGVGVKW